MDRRNQTAFDGVVAFIRKALWAKTGKLIPLPC
jgi:hypothetical protein